ncbi:MAG: MgtC/SapB family protein [Acidimicrobiia bacterium]|nr:MgtC/SapB family protein [Acidimicrobiia bacterium]
MVSDIGVSVADQFQMIGIVIVAAALGAVLGTERELASKSAGVRTHMLLAGASALAVSVGQVLFVADGGTGDPARALHAVLTGIGFLGAGAIIRHQDTTVEGLTTAASLWFAAAVGAATGFGLVVLAAGATAVGIFVLRSVSWMSVRIRGKAPVEAPDDGAG